MDKKFGKVYLPIILFQVYRLPPQSNVPAEGPSSTLSMMVVTKEKKQKSK